MTDGSGTPHVVGLSAEERRHLEVIVMDGDTEAALAFLKQVILKRLREAESKGMRTQLRP